MQPDGSRKLIQMLVKRILDEIFPHETGAARLQQVGLFTLIYMQQGEKEPVTARQLAMMTGQSEGQVGIQLKKLIAIELVERTKITNKQGRGRAYKLTIKHTKEAERLVKAIDKVAPGRKGVSRRRTRAVRT
jgi:DNA-binding transcriptional ArsR family regulator